MCSLPALILLCSIASCYGGVISKGKDMLIGWQAEKYGADLLHDPLYTHDVKDLPYKMPLPASSSWVEQISWKPRAYIWHNFLSAQEARHMIKLALPHMKRSTVVGDGGKSIEDDYRTSYGGFINRYQDAVVERIENKVAAWTYLPVENQEDIQILRYGVGQFYMEHSDTLVDSEAGIRVATVLIYLHEPHEGGETAFPHSQWIDPSLASTYGKDVSTCAKGHVAVKPKMGDALLFWSLGPDGITEDFHASHMGCPVLAGSKWTATIWIHAKAFRMSEMLRARANIAPPVVYEDPGYCQDTGYDCVERAAQGWCESNKDYMIVDVAGPGQCRQTCGVCKPCDLGDMACYNQNRKNIGFLVISPQEVA